MHHALLISEVAKEICAMIEHSSLPAVARTCRALLDPALDELWRDLYSIYPFVQLLSQAKPGENQQACVSVLTLQHWVTLRKYSVRTRTLYVCMVDEAPYSNQFSSLSNPPDANSFFPNLRAIAWYPDNHLAMLPFFRLLCGPALTSLSAAFATDPVSLAVVADLGTLCPNISDISISASSETLNNDLTNALSTSICHWENLTHVSCDDLTAAALEHLSQARNLDSLTACASVHLSSFSQTLSPQELTFPRLQHLHLYTGLLSTTATCFKGLRLALNELRLDLFDAEEVFSGPSCLHDLFAALAQACVHACLARLYLCVIHPHLPVPVTTMRDVRPLLNFTRLRILSLEGMSTFTFTDEDIAELVSAWPELEELALSTCVDHPVVSLPTLASLLCLIRACPKLKSLALVLDARTVPLSLLANVVAHVPPHPPPPSSRHAPAHTHLCLPALRSEALRHLCLGNSPIQSPVSIALVLHGLYPELTQVDLSVWRKAPLDRPSQRGDQGWDGDWSRYEACWGLVNMELQSLMSRARDRESVCAGAGVGVDGEVRSSS